MNLYFRKYSRYVFFISGLFIVFVVLFSYHIDPFSLYGRIYKKNGLEVNGHAFAKHLRMVHPYAVKRRKPEVLMMGSSRVAFGFKYDPNDNKFFSDNVYNIGLLGVTQYELLRYLQHAAAVSTLKRVILGVDFYQFNANLKPKPDFEEERLAVNVDNEPNAIFTGDYLPSLLSVDSAIESFKEALKLGKDKDIYLANGFKLDVLEGGDINSFRVNERGYVEGVYKNFTFDKKAANTFNHFRRIIEFCYEKNINLLLFIPPAHARQWEVISVMGYWPQWEKWKYKMVEITEEIAIKHNKKPFPLIDFSGYSQYSTESVPRKPGRPMKWYRDSAHFLPALGDIVLDKILLGAETNEAVCDGEFGVLMTSKNIDEHLQCINQKHNLYVSTHAQDISDIKALFVQNF